MIKQLLTMTLLIPLISFSQWEQKGDVKLGDSEFEETFGPRFGQLFELSADGNHYISVRRGEYPASADTCYVYEYEDSLWVMSGSPIPAPETFPGLIDNVNINGDGTVFSMSKTGSTIDYSGSGGTYIFHLVEGEWVLKGEPISGEYAYEYAGIETDLSADGNRIAIGAQLNDDASTNAGCFRVYEFSEGDWIQLGESVLGDQEFSQFGRVLSMSNDGNSLVVSSPVYDGDGLIDNGLIRVYQWMGSEWVQTGDDVYGTFANNQIGWRLDINSNGSHFISGHTTAPYVYGALIYKLEGAEWTIVGSPIDLPGEQLSDIAINGDGRVAAIGASHADVYGTNNGFVKVYEFDELETDWAIVDAPIGGTTVHNGLCGYMHTVCLSDLGNVVSTIEPQWWDDPEAWYKRGKVRIMENDWLCESTESAINVTSCSFYTVPSGDETYEEVGEYVVMDTLTNYCGGDSIISIYLTLNASYFDAIDVSVCEDYTVPSGDETYSDIGSYLVYDTLSSVLTGCDSVLSINLTIGEVSAEVSYDGSNLMAELEGATYQWFDCDDNTIIDGETDQTYSPISDGNYAVIVSDGMCTDTSECVEVFVNNIGLTEDDFFVNVAPNPTNGVVIVQNSEGFANISILDASGKLVYEEKIQGTNQEINLNHLSAGMYLVKVETLNHSELIKLIVK